MFSLAFCLVSHQFQPKWTSFISTSIDLRILNAKMLFPQFTKLFSLVIQVCVALILAHLSVLTSEDNGQALPNVASSKVDTYCHATDAICLNDDLVLPAHLTYGENAAAAAAFVVS